MSATIPGRLTADSYAMLANRNRPHDPDQLAIEVQRLALQGLTLRDIASAMRLDISTVARLLVRNINEVIK